MEHWVPVGGEGEGKADSSSKIASGTENHSLVSENMVKDPAPPFQVPQDLGSSLNFCYILLLNGNGTPLQYSCLENPMDGGAWRAAVHGVAEGRTRLRDFTFTFHFHALEKEMAPHSSVLAWRIPGTAEPGGLPSMGSHRVGHD